MPLAVVLACAVFDEIHRYGVSILSGFETIQYHLYQSRSFCLAGACLQTYFFIMIWFVQSCAFWDPKSALSCEALQDKKIPISEQIDGVLLFRIVYCCKHHLPYLIPIWLAIGFLFGDIPMAICDLVICVSGIALFNASTLLLNNRYPERIWDSSPFYGSFFFFGLSIVAIWFFQIAYGELYLKVIPASFAEICWPLAFDFSNYATALTFVLIFAWVRKLAIQASKA